MKIPLLSTMEENVASNDRECSVERNGMQRNLMHQIPIDKSNCTWLALPSVFTSPPDLDPKKSFRRGIELSDNLPIVGKTPGSVKDVVVAIEYKPNNKLGIAYELLAANQLDRSSAFAAIIMEAEVASGVARSFASINMKGEQTFRQLTRINDEQKAQQIQTEVAGYLAWHTARLV